MAVSGRVPASQDHPEGAQCLCPAFIFGPLQYIEPARAVCVSCPDTLTASELPSLRGSVRRATGFAFDKTRGPPGVVRCLSRADANQGGPRLPPCLVVAHPGPVQLLPRIAVKRGCLRLGRESTKHHSRNWHGSVGAPGVAAGGSNLTVHVRTWFLLRGCDDHLDPVQVLRQCKLRRRVAVSL
jgi:hypothetical protein